MHIQSRQNETIKRVKQLHAAKGRAEQGLHITEGEKLLGEALKWARVNEVFVLEALVQGINVQGAQLYTVTEEVLLVLSDTKTPQGVVATVQTPAQTPPSEYPKGLIVALDTVQDPGNLGAIIRTADAMGCAGILLGQGSADTFSPKAVRAAMGSTYHLPIWRGDLLLELPRLKAQGFELLAGHLGGEEEPQRSGPAVLVVGNESRGVSEEVAKLCKLCKLQMPGDAESLNAAVAASIMIYELSKQP